MIAVFGRAARVRDRIRRMTSNAAIKRSIRFSGFRPGSRAGYRAFCFWGR